MDKQPILKCFFYFLFILTNTTIFIIKHNMEMKLK